MRLTAVEAPFLWRCCYQRHSSSRCIQELHLPEETKVLTEPAALAASKRPADLSCRMSKHSSRPSSPAAAMRPWEGETPNLLIPVDLEVKDSWNLPSSKFNLMQAGFKSKFRTYTPTIGIILSKILSLVSASHGIIAAFQSLVSASHGIIAAFQSQSQRRFFKKKAEHQGNRSLR